MRSTTLKQAVLSVLTGAAISLCFSSAQTLADDEERIPASRIVQGFRIAPVPLNLQGKKRTLVGLGSYLVNAGGGCNDCHTNPSYAAGGNPFFGQPEQVNTTNYLAGGTAFGPFVSRNITPDAEGKPAGLTRDEFIQLMRTGFDEDEGRLLQVMPWPVYGKMTDQDLKAIYEYLSAIPHAEPAPPPAP
jgi:hypothetical protein